MSSHISLLLHAPEETVVCDFHSSLKAYPSGHNLNPISDYFTSTKSLIQKIIKTNQADDAEILGLMLLGVVSAAEFYFRSVICAIASICPKCQLEAESIQIPIGSSRYYQQSGFSPALTAFEHVSLADSKKITSEILRFTGLKCNDNSSVKKALDDFEMLCEIRHCYVHSRGFVGLKAARALNAPRSFQKLLIDKNQALDFVKLSHNAVRAVNRFLSDSTVNRWIQDGVLTGSWKRDKHLFESLWYLFAVKNEDQFSGIPSNAYSQVKVLVKKRQAATTNTSTANP